jgi:predicted nucleic acid-binding protein
MRLVLDTNVVASGLLWNGTPARLIEAAQADEIEVFTSRVLLAELTRILRRAKFAKAIAAGGLGLDIFESRRKARRISGRSALSYIVCFLILRSAQHARGAIGNPPDSKCCSASLI